MDKEIVPVEAFELSRLAFVHVYSDCMSPTYKEADIVIVDTEYTHPTGGGVFALSNVGLKKIGSNVVRCEFFGSKGIGIFKDNKYYKDMQMMAIDEFSACVIGRVVGEISSRMLTGRTLKI